MLSFGPFSLIDSKEGCQYFVFHNRVIIRDRTRAIKHSVMYYYRKVIQVLVVRVSLLHPIPLLVMIFLEEHDPELLEHNTPSGSGFSDTPETPTEFPRRSGRAAGGRFQVPAPLKAPSSSGPRRGG